MSVQFSEFTARLLNMSEEMKPLNVRRCLFGKPDSEQLSRDLERQLQKVYEEDARRFKELWSFDPIKGPIEDGKFQYELISGSDVPSFYTKGYKTRKSKHVRIIRDRSFNTEPCRFNSAKRKLDLDGQENIENEILNKRVPNRGDKVNDSEEQNVQSCTSSVVVSPSGNSSCSRLCDLPVGLSRLSTLSSLPDLSPPSRDKDIMTPPSKVKSLVQSSMKDYLANKKQRKLNTKSLSRP